MEFDFEQDIKQILHNGFPSYGNKFPMKNNISEMLINYLTVHSKLIAPKVRQVLYNPILKSNLHTHPKRKEIEHLASLFEKGKDVNLFQSEKFFQAGAPDDLLIEWNIRHFHLSLNKEKRSPFFKRTNQLLFVYLEDSQAIFLDVSNHSPGIFGDIKWIEILHEHFQNIIKAYKEYTMNDVGPKVDSIGRQELWRKGYTLGMTNGRGVVYRSPGTGRMTSGHSFGVMRTVNKILRWLHPIKQQFLS